MKKVLAIAPYPYLPYFSGGQKFIARFFEYLGKETDLLVISTGNDWSLAKNYRHLPLLKESSSRYMDFSLVKKISDLIIQEDYDTLIYEHPYFSWLVSRVKKRTGIKVILHTHNIEYQRFRSMGKWWWPLLKGYEKRSFKKADGIFFITPEDKNFAINQWNIAANKCADVPFGIDVTSFPADRDEDRKLIATKHGIGHNEKILSFNGLLDYKPNIDALKVILEEINPVLLKDTAFKYKIIISGKRLPAAFNSLKEYADKNIIYTGFVDDITPYLKASDIFLNPVQSGGGIKTKMVEAIGYGTTVIATASGASGIRTDLCGKKLIQVKDSDWNGFVRAIVEYTGENAMTPTAYYSFYSWDNITSRVKDIL